jgi:hypothetical protein
MFSEGESLKLVAPAVGCISPTALTRVITQKLGLSPTERLSKSRSVTGVHDQCHNQIPKHSPRCTRYFPALRVNVAVCPDRPEYALRTLDAKRWTAHPKLVQLNRHLWTMI